MLVKSLGGEEPLEMGMATHSSIPALRIPWTKEPGGLQSIVSQRVWHDWGDLAAEQLTLVFSVLLPFLSPVLICSFARLRALQVNVTGTSSLHRCPLYKSASPLGPSGLASSELLINLLISFIFPLHIQPLL